MIVFFSEGRQNANHSAASPFFEYHNFSFISVYRVISVLVLLVFPSITVILQNS